MKTTRQRGFGKRILGGSLSLLSLGVGFYFSWSMIAHDWPRMFVWQKVLFWVADIGAVLCVLRWMLVEPFMSPRQNNSNGRAVAIMMLVSLVLDVGATGASMHSVTLGMQRAIDVKAEVTSVSENRHGGMRQIRLDITFKDQLQAVRKSKLSFVEVIGRPVEPWERKPLAVATREVESTLIDVMYDPLLPTRVWFKGQDPGSATGIAVFFMVIHIAQAIFVLWLGSGLISKDLQVDSRNSVYLLVPIIIEAIGLVFLGGFTWAP